jgi:hypothetical protein
MELKDIYSCEFDVTSKMVTLHAGDGKEDMYQNTICFKLTDVETFHFKTFNGSVNKEIGKVDLYMKSGNIWFLVFRNMDEYFGFVDRAEELV